MSTDWQQPNLLDELEQHDQIAESIVLGSDAARAVGRFTPGGPIGYHAETAPDAPLRADRSTAEDDELRHRAGCDYRAGYIAALRCAATYVQDYEHDPAIAARIQAPMLRAIAIVECPDCNTLGCVVDDQGHHIDHHPIGGATDAARADRKDPRP